VARGRVAEAPVRQREARERRVEHEADGREERIAGRVHDGPLVCADDELSSVAAWHVLIHGREVDDEHREGDRARHYLAQPSARVAGEEVVYARVVLGACMRLEHGRR